jgi:hypothetical protein
LINAKQGKQRDSRIGKRCNMRLQIEAVARADKRQDSERGGNKFSVFGDFHGFTVLEITKTVDPLDDAAATNFPNIVE